MNVDTFVRWFHIALAAQEFDGGNTSTEWTTYMARVLHTVQRCVSAYCCCHLGGSPHADGEGREYLWDMTWYARDGARWDLPEVVIEHENGHSDAAFFVDFWKVMAAWAPLRVMIGYTDHGQLEARARVEALHELVRAQAWSFPPGATDLVALREYAGSWRFLLRPPGTTTFRAYQPPGSDAFAIFGRASNHDPVAIASLDEWERFAGPMRPDQWRNDYSARELARAWFEGSRDNDVAPHVRATLERHADWRGFVPRFALAEATTRLDGFGGPRHHDLIVFGDEALLDIEGKGNETSGERVDDWIDNALKKSAASNVPRRAEWLADELGIDRAVARTLRQQHLVGVAAALRRAKGSGLKRALHLFHVFETPAMNERRHAENHADLVRFVEALTRGEQSIERDGIVGPIHVPGGAHLPHDVALYVGKAITSAL